MNKISINQWLQLASMNKVEEMKKVSTQIDINSVDREGNAALNMACRHSSVEVIFWLLSQPNINPVNENDIGMIPIFNAIMEDNLDIINALIKKFPNLINHQNSAGLSPLHIACANQSDNAFNYLIQLPTINLNLKDKKEQTVLSLCAIANNIDYTQKLLKHGANAAITNKDLVTPLMQAAMLGFHEIVQLMLLHTPQMINQKNKYGETALHIAAIKRSLDNNANKLKTLETLINHGANLKELNNDNETPQDYAKKFENFLALEFLNSVEEKNKFDSTLNQTYHTNKKSQKI